MKKTIKFMLIVLAPLVLLVLWLLNMDMLTFDKSTTQAPTVLEIAGNECSAIAEKSIAQLTAVVEYQKLEIAGRKVRVMRNCMDDHGFIENSAWVSFATQNAQEVAKKQNISFDEAIEGLKRKKMLDFTANDQTPLYWLAKQTSK